MHRNWQCSFCQLTVHSTYTFSHALLLRCFLDPTVVHKNVDDSGWLRVAVSVMLVSRRLNYCSQISVERQADVLTSLQSRSDASFLRPRRIKPLILWKAHLLHRRSVSMATYRFLRARASCRHTHTCDSHSPSPAFRSFPPPTSTTSPQM